MKTLRCLVVLLCVLIVAVPAFTEGGQGNGPKDDGFVPMFNGKDLAGWVNVNGAPGTFYVKDDQIITTGKPTGFLRTEKQYENFILEFDWMHVPPKADAVGNSGLFVWADPIPAVGTGYTRGIEVQVLVNLEWKDKDSGAITASSHGDIFSIWGAKCVPDRPHPLGWERCMPSEKMAKGANEWNHYRVEANDGVIKLAVNGKVVSGVSKCSPRKGYLALESEGSECRFKNIKIKELPSTNPKPDEIADVAQGHKTLYTGLDLSGWQTELGALTHWQPKDTVLHYDGKGEAKDNGLLTKLAYGDAEFIADFRFPKDNAKPLTFVLRGDKDFEGRYTIAPDGKMSTSCMPEKGGMFNKWKNAAKFGVLKPGGQWNRMQVTSEGKSFAIKINNFLVYNLKNMPMPAEGYFGLRPEGAIDFANLFVRQSGKKEQ